MNKIGTFGDIQNRLRAHVAASRQIASKQASEALAEGQLIDSEKSISLPSSDPEVNDLLPTSGVPSEPKKDLTNTGVGTGESMPGVSTSLKSTEKEWKEQSPGAKLASVNPQIEALQNRLSENLRKAAEAMKVADDEELGNKEKADTSNTPATIVGTQGVTQTPVAAAGSTDVTQGTKEVSPEAKLAEVDMEALSRKVAQYSQDVLAGRTMAHQMVGYMQDMANPVYQDQQKLAEAVQNNTIISTVGAVVDAGLESGIISYKQADDLMKMAGFQINPLYEAIENVQQKIAALDQSPLSLNQKVAFVMKCAEPEEAMAAAGGQAPIDPAQLQAAIGQLLEQLQAAVQSGQMTEEQALQVLAEQGIPIDQIIGSDGVVDGAQSPGGQGGPPPEIGGEQAEIGEAAPKPPGAPEPDTEPKEKEASLRRGKLADKIASFLEGGMKTANAGDPGTPGSINPGLPAGVTPEQAFLSAQAETSFPTPGITGKPNYNEATPSFGRMSKVPLQIPIEIPVAQASPAGAFGRTDTVQDLKDTTEVAGRQEGIAAEVAAMNKAKADAAATSNGLGDAIKKWFSSQGITAGGAALTAGGLGLGAYAANKLMSDDEEEENPHRKRKHAEADPSMMAAPADPSMGGAPAGAEQVPSLEEVLQEIQAAVQGGLITMEQAQEIVAVLQQGGDPGAGQPPAAAPVAM